MGATTPRHERLERLLDAALDADPGERASVLARECPDDAALRAEAHALLAALDRSADFLETPAAALLGLGGGESPEPSRAGEVIGSWRVVRELGRGGMGTVYLAEREAGGFRQQVALKLVRAGAGAPGVAARFVAERQILARLEHPHLARLVDGGTTPQGEPWFAMEYIEGDRVTTWCDERRAGLPERLALFAQVADAVRFAHRNLIVHRDLKPSNILVDASGNARLLDFGIAKVLGEATPDGATATGLWAMTPEFAAPEQVRGEAITTATDVYALGAVLYELLTGHRAHPLERLTPREVERVVCEVDPPPMSEVVLRNITPVGGASSDGTSADLLAARRGSTPARLRHLLAGDLDVIVARALHKDVTRRYPTVDALLDDLQRYQQGLPVHARRDSRWYRARKFLARHRVGVAAGVAITGALVAGALATLWQARVARAEARKAGATRDFVLDLFRSANPDQSLGRELTARALVDRGLQRIDSVLAGQPGTQQELLGVLGVTYRELGLLTQADSAVRRGVALARQAFGPTSDEYAARLRDLGTVLNVAGEYAAADTVLTEALAVLQARHGPEAAVVGSALSELANNLEDTGDWVRAESLHRAVLRIDARHHGRESLEYATDLDNLGVTLYSLRRFAAADSAYRGALAIRERLLPPDHPQRLTVLGNLGAALEGLGNAAAAESLARLVLAGRRRILASGHPDLAYSLNSVATSLEDQGRLAEAEPFYREAIVIRRAALGPDHAVTMQSVNNLAVLFVRIGQFDSAAVRFREVVERWSTSYGADDSRTATAINNLGVALTSAGRLAEAEGPLRRALAIRRATFGDTAMDVGISRRNVAVLLLRQGRLADAEREVRAALDNFSRSIAAGHPRFAEAWTTLGEVFLATGRPSAADSVLALAREVQEARLPGFDYRRAETAWLLGRARMALGRAASAESLFAEAEGTWGLFDGHRTRARSAAADRARARALRSR